MKAVSACLAGEKCRYDGQSKPNEQVVALYKNGKVVLFCPEILGGLKIPRVAAEIVGGDGYDVLDGKAKVVNQKGEVVTDAFLIGAIEALETLKAYGITHAVLKAKSPSCGVNYIYDGTFSGTLKKGVGVAAALFIRNEITVEPM